MGSFIVCLLACGMIVLNMTWSWATGLILYFLSVNIHKYASISTQDAQGYQFYNRFINGWWAIVGVGCFRFAIVNLIYQRYGFISLFWFALLGLVITPYGMLIEDRYSAFTRWIFEQKKIYIESDIQKWRFSMAATLLNNAANFALLVSLFKFIEGIWFYQIFIVMSGAMFIFYYIYHARKKFKISDYNSLGKASPQKLTFKEIFDECKESFTRYGIYSTSISEKVNDIMAYYINPFFIRCQIGANTVSISSFLVQAIAAVVIISPVPWAWPVGLILYVIATIGDHIAGRLARATLKASFWGKFIEGWLDILGLTCIRMALTWVIYIKYSFCMLFWVALFSTLIIPYCMFMYDRYSSFARWINQELKVNIRPYLRNEKYVRPAHVIVDIERIMLLLSLFMFVPAMWGYFIVNSILYVGFITYHLYSASLNFPVLKSSSQGEIFNRPLTSVI